MSIADQILEVVQGELREMNTSAPGVIVSYDGVTNRAVVRASLPKRLADNSDLPAPQIVSVPVIWPEAGGAIITMPIRPGDGVLLNFSQRGLDNWLSGTEGTSDDPRAFDMTDAIATPGLRAMPTGPVDTDNMVISFGGVTLKLTPGGKLLIEAPGGIEIVAPTTKSTGDILATETISLTTHVHVGVVSGAALTGIPNV